MNPVIIRNILRFGMGALSAYGVQQGWFSQQDANIISNDPVLHEALANALAAAPGAIGWFGTEIW